MHERIVTGIDWWLNQEIENSRSDGNAVLDEYERTRQDYLLDSTDQNNRDALKQARHYDRYKKLMNDMKADPSLLKDEFGAGKILHHSLMFMSGAFRTQCFLQAGSQEEYNRLRFESGRGHDIDLDLAVEQSLDLLVPVADSVIDYSLAMNDAMAHYHQQIGTWFAQNPGRSLDALGPDEPPVEAMRVKQRLATATTVGHIILSADMRHGIENVPFLEPTSISRVGTPIYPLAA